MPISGGEKLLAALFGADRPLVESESVARNSGKESPENNRAMEIAVRLSVEEEDDGVMPELPDDPSDEDLLDFASKHPAVRNVARLFRGKVVAVKKRT